jgi:hypothetical protein
MPMSLLAGLHSAKRLARAISHASSSADADCVDFAKTKLPDYYAMYTAHNYECLACSKAMLGPKTETLDAARKVRAIISDDLLLAMPGADWYLAEAERRSADAIALLTEAAAKEDRLAYDEPSDWFFPLHSCGPGRRRERTP